MKIALFALFFLLFTFTKAEYVYDTDGDPIPKGALYYILTGTEFGSGYLSLLNFGEQSCPLFVVDSVFGPGAPPQLAARFWSNMIYQYTPTDVPLNFTFVGIPLCAEISKWYVTEHRLPLGNAVSFGVAEGIPHVNGDFKITNYGNSYKIVFCPEESPETCGDLSISEYEGTRFLVVKYDGDDPLIIRFQKPHASSASGKSMAV